jgi:putative endonuclease
MKQFTSAKQRSGKLGENIACRYLEKAGFVIIERNYTRRWGELDIVSSLNGKIHFVEVKSVSHESVSGRLLDLDEHRPEDNIHVRKLGRISRTIRTYLSEHRVGDWQFDVMCVYIDPVRRIASARVIADIIL